MKQKMVIKVQIKCDKCRIKAMKIAASKEGVDSLALDGTDRDHVVVVGNGVDCVDLTNSLRRKMGYADLVKVEELKK